MSVVVKSNKVIDQALSMLQREVSRERILQTFKENRYYVKPKSVRHELKKAWMKTKKWRRKIRRQKKNRGHI